MAQLSTSAAPEPPAPVRRGRAALAGITGLVVLLAALVSFFLWPGGDGGAPAAGTTPAAVKATRYRLVVKSLHIDAPIVAVGLSRDRVLTPPANPRDVGWWNASATPGASTGQTIIAGHTVHTGGGQFDHLGSIEKGARIEVVRRHRTVTYVATKVVTLSKQQVSARAQQLFGQGRAKNRLVLITCGDWTGHSYLTNVFVYATPVKDGAPTAGTTATGTATGGGGTEA
jgi:LPXTG-site transpeptidase (sortase) family protein